MWCLNVLILNACFYSPEKMADRSVKSRIDMLGNKQDSIF